MQETALCTILVQIAATPLVTHPGAEFTLLGLGRCRRKVAAWAAEDEQREGSLDPHVA